MSGLSQFAQVLAPAAGMGIGFAVGGPTGALIGSSIGSAVAGGISLMNQPKAPEIYGGIYANKATQDYLTTRLMSGQGLNETQYSRMMEAAKQRSLTQMNQILGMAKAMPLSPLQLDKLATEVLNTQARMAKEQLRIEDIDTNQLFNNLKMAISSQAQSNQMAAQIAQMEQQRQVMQMKLEQQKMAAFAKVMQGLASAGMLLKSSQTPADTSQVDETNTEDINNLSPEEIRQKKIRILDKAFYKTDDPFIKAGLLEDWVDLTAEEALNG